MLKRCLLTFLCGLVCLTMLQKRTLAAPTTAPTTAPTSQPYEKEILAFETADHREAPPTGAVLFLGSSSIRKWTTVARDFPNEKVINRGFGGSKIADSVRYADRIAIPYRPRQIIFYAGDNDIASGVTPEKVLENFKALVNKIHEKLPDTRIDFISIKPSLARWKLIDKIKEANRLVEAWCKEGEAAGQKVGYIDVFGAMLGEDGKPKPELFVDDGLHMNRKGYEIWIGIVGPRIVKE